jgi:hypothetical protein
MLPELWKDELARDTPYLFFFELLPFVRDAHRAGDEHLFDSFDIRVGVLKRLHAQVVSDVWPRWERRLDEMQLRALRARIGATR